MDLSSLMETVFSVGIVVAMVALVAWRRYKEGQGKPASGKRAVSAGTGKRPVMQRPAEREPVEKREPMPSQKKKRNTPNILILLKKSMTKEMNSAESTMQ